MDNVYGPPKVQVTILAGEWGSSKGELSTINTELAIQLAKFPEVEITFFLPQCSEMDKKLALEHNVKIVEAKPRPGLDIVYWLHLPPEDLQMDIIVGHGVILGQLAQFIKRSKRCKWVQFVHTDAEELGMFKNYSHSISRGEEKHKAEVKLCELADHVVAVGPKLCDAFRSYLRSCHKDDNVVDFTPGVFEEFVAVKQALSERRQRIVLVFGRGYAEDFELKGFDIAGKAVAALQDTRLVVVGAPDGEQEQIAKRLIGCGVPASRLRVRRFTEDRETLKHLFQEVDLVVVPSRTEGFGLAGLQALSAGLPVLVSGNSGFGEALCSVPCGSSYVVNSEDPTVWTAAINNVLAKDRESRLEDAEILRESYGRKYKWAKQAKELVNKMIRLTLGRKRKASQEVDGMIEDKKARNIFSHLQDLQSDTVLVSNMTNPLSDLRKIASDKGFVISDNPASGNCLFYALSEQLQSVKAIHISHEELRETLVQFLTTNAYLRDGTPLLNFVSGYPSWREYLQSMAKDGTWGDHMVLLAAANYFQSPIRIISSRDHEIVVQPDHAVADIIPLVLGHVHEFHYVSLHPSQESIPSYVLARGQTAAAAFIKAKADGWTVDKRVKVLLIGQDRVGKTSVGRSLKGETFRANEISTEGVQMYEPLKNPGNQPWKNYVLQHDTTAFHHKSAEIISREVQSKSTGGQTPKKSLGTDSQESSNLDATADNSQNSKQALTLQSSMDTNQKDSPSEFSNLSRPDPLEEEGTASLHSTPDNEKKMENTSSNEPVLMDNKIADLTAEKLHRKETDIPDGIWPVVWDFAGQALFRAIHPIFMSSEAVYVLVWDLTRDLFAKAQCKVNEDGREEVDVLTADSNDTNLDHILRWLDMVHSLRPEGNSEFPPVILVGTHADEVNFPDKKKEELEEFLRVNFEDYYNHVVESVTMDNTLAGRPIQEEDKRICQLRQITLKEAENLSHTQKKIPLKWLEVENKVCDHIKKSEDKYMTKQSFKEKIVDQICQPDRDQNLAEHILNFMHDRGSIVYLDHPETPNGLVVLDPQWLVHDVLCKIVTIKNQKGDKPEIKRYRRNLKEKGILNVALLNYACENLNLHGIKKHLILIMRKFNLLCENTKDINGETEYLVPCMLTRKPEKDLTCDDRKVVCEPVFITFDTEYVPFGLFSRILVLFGQWAASRTSCERPQLFANAARFFIAKTTSLSVRFDCFKRVIKIFILKGTEPNPMHNNQQVLLQASRFLKQILERLKQECHWLRRVSLRLCAQCKLCLKTKSCLWHKEQKCSHEDCTHYVDINDKPFVCVNDLSSNSAIPQTWIQVLASGKEDVKQCVKVKMGIPSNEVLEELSLRITEKWRQLGRRLRIDEPQLDAFDRENHQWREKGYKMLLSWKQRDGGSGASYQVLYDALCHNLVGLGKLAKEICCD